MTSITRGKRRRLNSRDRLKKVLISCYLEPEDYAALKALSTHTGVPQQVYLRRGLEMVLRTYPSESFRPRAAAIQQRRQAVREEMNGAMQEWSAAKLARDSQQRPVRKPGRASKS